MMFSIWRSPLLRTTVSVMSPSARLISKNKVVTSPASPHHRPSSGIVNQKSSSVARSGVDHQIKKVCTSQVSLVLRGSSVSSKMKRCYAAEIQNFRIVSRAALKGYEGREFDAPVVDDEDKSLPLSPR